MKMTFSRSFRLLSRTTGLWDCAPGAETGLVEIGIHDLRAFTKDKHRTVDDRVGGGEAWSEAGTDL